MKSIPKSCLACCFLLCLLLSNSNSWGWRGTVIELSDGDSGVAGKGWGKVNFRLYGIDAPELDQDYGIRAKAFTARMLLWKQMEFKALDHDRYGREVGLAYVSGKCVNEELVKAGLAWVYGAYCTQYFCDNWSRLQQQAKEQRLGLWGMKNPTAPWTYRQKKSSSRSPGVLDFLITLVTDYHGNVASRVFHRAGCKHYNCEHCTARFASREEAIKQGFKPCGSCNP
jgi:micrococcal nuclease